MKNPHLDSGKLRLDIKHAIRTRLRGEAEKDPNGAIEIVSERVADFVATIGRAFTQKFGKAIKGPYRRRK